MPSIPKKYSRKNNSTRNKEKRMEKRLNEPFIKTVLNFFKISGYSNLNKISTFALLKRNY